MRILLDQDVARVLTMADAVAAMRGAFQARADGHLTSPPRAGFSAGAVGLRWTPGALHGQVGLRLYMTGVSRGDQLTALWRADGTLRALAIGPTVGRLRTGAIGGVAIDVMARPDARVLGIIGFGAQGWMQLEAALAVRPIERVWVYRRDAGRLAADAAKASERFGLPVEPAPNAEHVARTADILVTATRADAPVVQASWLAPGVHVNALGPKAQSGHEIGLDLVERAALVASDVPEQYQAERDFLLHGTPYTDRIRDLAGVMTARTLRDPTAVTLFLSHGLPGTEVALLARAAEAAEARGVGAVLADETW
ncbi:MAG: hypothetical protein M0Z54_14045 [Thermaerobacter sp.]|nr:hypothetical protein [Thermaerobacter sp.]